MSNLLDLVLSLIFLIDRNNLQVHCYSSSFLCMEKLMISVSLIIFLIFVYLLYLLNIIQSFTIVQKIYDSQLN